ncbi:hypothetical protein [Neolewinella maritima]|nr:hypothetical protein [Neolewinella maritima]
MRQLFVSLLVVCSCSLMAQFGATAYYNFNDARLLDWPGADLGTDRLRYDNSVEAALHYWFRLPKRRIEFQPTVYYARQLSGSTPASNELGAQFKTNIYLFDLSTDCNCPTFGKQGPQLQKGFFMQLSPGISSHQFTDQDRHTAFTVGGGIGVDIGISNLLTLTPIAAVRHTLGGIPTFEQTTTDGIMVTGGDQSLTSFQLGIQATFRLDKRHY